MMMTCQVVIKSKFRSIIKCTNLLLFENHTCALFEYLVCGINFRNLLVRFSFLAFESFCTRQVFIFTVTTLICFPSFSVPLQAEDLPGLQIRPTIDFPHPLLTPRGTLVQRKCLRCDGKFKSFYYKRLSEV